MRAGAAEGRELAQPWTENGDELLARAMHDLLNRVHADALASAIIVPCRVLIGDEATEKDYGPSTMLRGNARTLPSRAWTFIRENHPQTAVLPLGPVTKRAFLRCVSRLAISSRKTTELWMLVKERGRSRAFEQYITLWLFEAAMFNLRGLSTRKEWNHGFWYHWTPEKEYRTLTEERTLRKRLLGACRSGARRLVGRWQEGLSGCQLLPTAQQVAEAFISEFGVMTLAPKVTKTRKRPVTVLGLKPGRELTWRIGPVSPEARLIVPQERMEKNINLDTTSLEERCGELGGDLRDLLEIAATVYMADIHVPRDCLLARDLSFLVPVRAPELWRKNSATLSKLVSFLSRNYTRFRFVSTRHQDAVRANSQSPDKESCVVLFSGGLDSFLGVVKLLKKRSAGRIFLVSHSNNAALRTIQKELEERLSDALQDRHKKRLIWIETSVQANRTRSQPVYRLPSQAHQTLYQHTRSFLFLTLAACVAICRGIKDVFVFENGPVALSPTFCEASVNTRTAHPVVLRYFRELVKNVFNIELQITNPFLNLTKGQALKQFGSRWPKLLGLTNSCWAYAKVGAWAGKYLKKEDDRKEIEDDRKEKFGGRHCGRCIPCMWRRAAFHHAGLEAYDDKYLWDFLQERKDSHPGLWESWLDPHHLTAILDQLRFCERFKSQQEPAARLDYCPDFYDIDPNETKKALEVYARFSKEFCVWSKCIRDQLRSVETCGAP